MDDYRQFRAGLLEELISRGFPREEHQPLAHPLILTNFTMSMAVPLLPERRKERIRAGNDFCTIQPCIRIHDAEDFAEEDEWWHLSFFEMAGAVVGGEQHRARTAATLLHLLTNRVGLEKDSIHFECFAGNPGLALSADKEMQAILNGLGVPASNIHMSEEQFFFSPNHEQAAGPMVEVFCQGGGRRLEIGTFATISHFYDAEQRLDKLLHSFTEFGLGIERLYCVTRGERNLDLTSPMHDLLRLAPMLERPERRLLADRLRAVYMLLSEGLRPRSRSREKILRHWMRDLGRALLSAQTDQRQMILLDALRLMHRLHADSYTLLSPAAAAEILISEFERYDWWG